MWVRIVQSFDWRAHRHQTIAFKPGHRFNAPRRMAEQWIEEGKATATISPRQEERDGADAIPGEGQG